MIERLSGRERQRLAELRAMAARARAAGVTPGQLGGATEAEARERADAWLAERRRARP